MNKLIKLIRVKLHNLFWFSLGLLRYNIPPWLWGKAWREVQEQHLQDVRKKVWELKKQGKVREDKEGRLWPRKL